MNLPKVSVIMSTFNNESTIENSVQSILNQNFKDFEFIIINDGSTDSTAHKLNLIKEKDKRLQVINQENQGLTLSLNKAIELSQAHYIARQDADDVSLPNRLSMLYENRKRAPFLISRWVNKTGDIISQPLFSKFPFSFTKTFLKYGNIFAHGTYFFHKNSIQKIGCYRERFRYSQDYDLILRVLENYPIHFIRQNLYELNLHSKSISQEKSKEQFQFALLASLFSYERKSIGYDSYDLLKTGYESQLLSQLLKKHKAHALMQSLFLILRSRKLSVIKSVFDPKSNVQTEKNS